MGPIQTIDEVFDFLRRRWRLVFAVSFMGAVASVFYALSQPHEYVSYEVIQIERPRIAGDLAPTTVEGSSARRLQLIQQQLLARASVVEVMEKYGIFADLSGLTLAEKVALFRESVLIEGVAAAREGAVDDGTIAALNISATFSRPEHAQAVARELSARTMALSAAERRAQTATTLDFFAQEEQVLSEAVEMVEQEIAAFRTENDILTTGRIEVSQTEIRTVNEALLAVERSRIALENELEQIDRTSTRPATLRRINELNRQLVTLDEQRQFLQDRLDGLQTDVQGSPQIEGQISILERRLEQYQSQLEVIANRRTEAEISHRLEASRQAERLKILEPAALPDYPVGPGRKKIAAAGTIASMFLGLGLAFLLELKFPVVRNSHQMKRELGIVPAAVVPVYTPKRPGLLRLILRSALRRFAPRPAKPGAASA